MKKMPKKAEWAKNQTVRASGLVEDVCEHGVGHPNKDWLKQYDPDGERGFGIHGCCGCCSCTSKQGVYDAIKKLREGYEVELVFNGKCYTIVPWIDHTTCGDGYCQDVLCKYHGRRIGIAKICWKDAGPNPRLIQTPTESLTGFIPVKNIYGAVKHA